LNTRNDLLVLVTTTQDTGTTGGDETNLLTRRSEAGCGGRVTNVLMVTTTVRMLDGVHRDTSDLRPAVTLDTVLVERGTGFQHRLVDTTTTGNDTNEGTRSGLDFLLGTGRQLQLRLLTIFGVTDDDARSTGGTSESSTVSELVFDHADDGTFRALSDGQAVTDGQLGVLSAVDELTSVDTFDGNQQFLVDLVLVAVTKGNSGERSSTTRVMENFLDQTLHVTVTFGIVQDTQLSGALAVLDLRSEDKGTVVTLSLTADDATHFGELLKYGYMIAIV